MEAPRKPLASPLGGRDATHGRAGRGRIGVDVVDELKGYRALHRRGVPTLERRSVTTTRQISTTRRNASDDEVVNSNAPRCAEHDARQHSRISGKLRCRQPPRYTVTGFVRRLKMPNMITLEIASATNDATQRMRGRSRRRQPSHGRHGRADERAYGDRGQLELEWRARGAIARRKEGRRLHHREARREARCEWVLMCVCGN